MSGGGGRAVSRSVRCQMDGLTWGRRRAGGRSDGRMDGRADGGTVGRTDGRSRVDPTIGLTVGRMVGRSEGRADGRPGTTVTLRKGDDGSIIITNTCG